MRSKSDLMNLRNEATTQGEFYHACRLIDLPVYLEINTPAGRVDAAITDKECTRLLAVVEVKGKHTAFLGGESKQILRYKKLGVPVYGLSGDNCPHRLAATIKRNATYTEGVLFSSFIGMEIIKIKERADAGKRIRTRFTRFRQSEFLQRTRQSDNPKA